MLSTQGSSTLELLKPPKGTWVLLFFALWSFLGDFSVQSENEGSDSSVRRYSGHDWESRRKKEREEADRKKSKDERETKMRDSERSMTVLRDAWILAATERELDGVDRKSDSGVESKS